VWIPILNSMLNCAWDWRRTKDNDMFSVSIFLYTYMYLFVCILEIFLVNKILIMFSRNISSIFVFTICFFQRNKHPVDKNYKVRSFGLFLLCLESFITLYYFACSCKMSFTIKIIDLSDIFQSSNWELLFQISFRI